MGEKDGVLQALSEAAVPVRLLVLVLFLTTLTFLTPLCFDTSISRRTFPLRIY